MLHCFLSLIIYGIRTGAGFGFSMKSFSDSHYWASFIFDWIFYFTIMLVLINIINGIIVDTFQNQREKTNALSEKILNTCYVCSEERAKFEAKGRDFKSHTNFEHNVLDYYQYFLKIDSIKASKKEEMTFTENYVLDNRNFSIPYFLPKDSKYLNTFKKK